MTNSDDIVKYARSLRGTKWVHQGRSVHGVDCLGLLIMMKEKFPDIEGEDLLGYRRSPSKEFMRHMKASTDPVRPRVPVNGSIGIFHDTTMPCHIGIFAVDSTTGVITVIHSEAFPKKCVHEQLYTAGNMPLSGRLVDIRYFRGVNYG